jgi:hypothetical protein
MDDLKSQEPVKPTFNEGVQTFSYKSVIPVYYEQEETPEDVRRRRYCLKWQKRYHLQRKIKTILAQCVAIISAFVIGMNFIYLLNTYSSSSAFNIIIALEIAAILYLIVYSSILDYFPNNDFSISIEAMNKYENKLKSRNRDKHPLFIRLSKKYGKNAP